MEHDRFGPLHVLGWLSFLFPLSAYVMRLSLILILLQMYETLVLTVDYLHVHVLCRNVILSGTHVISVPTSFRVLS